MKRPSLGSTRPLLTAITLILVALLLSVGAASARDPDAQQAAGVPAKGGAVELPPAPAGVFSGDVRTIPVDRQAQAAAAEWARQNPGQLRGMPGMEGREPQLDPRRVDQGDLPTPGPSAPAPMAAANFDGLNNLDHGHNVVPPDTTGAVGPTYYIQFINSADGGYVGIYRKSTGALVSGFVYKDLFASLGGNCATSSHSDPMVVYDSAKDRWILMDFMSNTPKLLCTAASRTNDPVSGGWNVYGFGLGDTSAIPDYEKIGIWPDGLYVGANMFSNAGQFQNARAYVFNTDDMYAGVAARGQYFNMPSIKVSGAETVYSPVPSSYHLTTGTPPAGRENYIATAYNAKIYRVWKYHVDWTNSAQSTLTGPTNLNLNTWSVAPSTVASTANALETLRERLTPIQQYTNLNGVESLWATHTVATTGATTFASPRWYQITVTGGTPSAVAQQATYSPDTTTSRMQASLAVDRDGSMLMAYSATSSTLHPSVRYAGRLSTDPLNTFGQSEVNLHTGGGGFSANCGGTCTRWGDYSSTFIDVDGCTFWFTHEYMPTTGLNWGSRIGAAKYPGCTTLTYAKSAPASRDFGTLTPGSNASRTVVVTNTGTGPLVLQPATKSGANSADFAITADGCKSAPVAAGASCSVSVTFTPTAAGSRTATLSIGTNVAAGDTVSVALAGVGATPPTTSAAASGTPGNSGWFVSPTVDVALTCVPAAEATCASTSFRIDGGAAQEGALATVSGDGPHTVQYWSVGSDGIVESAKSLQVKIDATAPVATLAGRSPAPNANGWNNVNVAVNWTCADATSGVVASSASATVSTQGAGQTASGTCTDVAGNTAQAVQGDISIDKTAPAIAGSRSPSPNEDGWANTDVTASWTCTDALSGVASLTPASTVTAEGADQSRSGTCVDLAGNSASVAVGGISIDKTAPVLVASRTPAPNGNGWNNADVTATWTCNDSLSSVKSAPASVVVSSDGAGQSASGTCLDKAGNAASSTVSNINIDKTAPTLATRDDILAVATAAGGATVTFEAPAASDATSGATAVACAPASGSFFALGSTAVACSVSDLAGNGPVSVSFQVIVSTSQLDHVAVTGPAALLAGETGSYTVTGYDAYGNVIGANGFTFSSERAGALEACGVFGGLEGCADVAVSPAALDHVAVTGPATLLAGEAGSYTVTGYDAYGNTIGASGFGFSSQSAGIMEACGAFDGLTGCLEVTVSPAALDHVLMTGPATLVAGEAGSYTVTGYDAHENVVGSNGFTFSTTTAGAAEACGVFGDLESCMAVEVSPAALDRVVVTGPSALVAGEEGAYAATGYDAYGNLVGASGFGFSTTVAGPADVCGAFDGIEACMGVDVSAGPLDHVVIEGPATLVAGETGAFLVTGYDAFGNVLGSSGFAFSSESVGFSDVCGLFGGLEACMDVTVQPAGLDHVAIAGPGTLVAGEPGAYTVTGYDAYGNPVGSAGFEFGSEAAGATLACGSFGGMETCMEVTVSPAALDRVVVTGPATLAKGETGAYTVTGFDAYGNLVGTGQFEFASSQAGATQACGSYEGLQACQDVTILDVTAPTIRIDGAPVHEATSAAGAAVSFAVVASDEDDSDVEVECDANDGDVFGLGEHAIGCVATDPSGNRASAGYVFRVVDTTAPVLAAAPGMVVHASDEHGAVVHFDAPASTDAVDGEGVADCGPASGSLFPVGETVVTCTAVDAAGNEAEPVTFTVTVLFELRAKVTMEKASYPATAAVSGVRGVVSLANGDGTALEGASVRVTVVRMVPLVGAADNVTYVGSTDAAGRFAFTAETAWALPGEYRVLVVAQKGGLTAEDATSYTVAPTAITASKASGISAKVARLDGAK